MIKEYLQLDLLGRKTFERAVVQAPFRFPAQLPDEACFYYVNQGCVQVYSSVSEKVTTWSSEGVVMRCGNYFNDFLATSEADVCEVVAVHFNPELLRIIFDKDLPGFLDELENVKPVIYQKYEASSLLKNYIDSLQFYFDNPELVSDELLKLKLRELMLLLARTDQVQAIKTLVSSLFNPIELDFKEIIEVNVFNNLSVEELAHLAKLSVSTFKREFAKHFNSTPAKYIRKRKLEKASQLLKLTQLRISDIAYDCGFADLAHFSKSFLKEYGSSPSDFRLASS